MAPPAVLVAYQRALQERPIRTKAIVGTVSAFLSSLMGQYTQTGCMPDLVLAVLFAVRGMPPYSHWWFGLISGTYNAKLNASLVAVLRPLQERVWTRVLLDQLLWRPLLTMYTFVAMGFLRLRPWEQTRAQIEERFFPTLRKQISIGIPQAFMNQGLVPLAWRTTFNDVFFLLWNAYLATQVRIHAPPEVPAALAKAQVQAQRPDAESKEKSEETGTPTTETSSKKKLGRGNTFLG